MFRQLRAVIWMGLSTIPARRGPALVVVVGMACAVGALISILSLSAGLSATVHKGRADRAIILSKGSQFEGGSSISHADAAIIADAPGIQKDADGKPAASPDATAFAAVPKKSDGFDAFVTVRGIGPQGLSARPEIKLVSGRLFQPGKYELIVGQSAASQFKGLELGNRVALPEGDWTVTGIFSSGGDTHESEILTDAAILLSSTRAPNYKSETVLLSSASAYSAFRSALTSNPALAVDVSRETDYLEKDWKSLNTLLSTVGWLVGGIMGLGATLGALNTMYTAVSARTVEIATLRAIGFAGSAVVASVMVEAILLAASGALIGAALAWAAFNGNQHVMGGLVIALRVTPSLVLQGLIFACLLGLVGGFFPAIRAARLPVVDALRAT